MGTPCDREEDGNFNYFILEKLLFLRCAYQIFPLYYGMK